MKSENCRAPEHDQTLTKEGPTLLSLILFWVILLALIYTCGLHAMAKYDTSNTRIEYDQPM